MAGGVPDDARGGSEGERTPQGGASVGMIRSFADPETELLFREEKSRRHVAIARVALRKLIQLNQAGSLKDLAVPPGNRLEALQRKRTGEYSIRINQQWRLVFAWGSQGPERVKIEDYH